MQPSALVPALLTVLCRLALTFATESSNSSVAPVHTVVTTECLAQFEWQVIGLAYRCVCRFLKCVVLVQRTSLSAAEQLRWFPGKPTPTVLRCLQLAASGAAWATHTPAGMRARRPGSGLSSDGRSGHMDSARPAWQQHARRRLWPLQPARGSGALAPGASACPLPSCPSPPPCLPPVFIYVVAQF